MTMKDNLTTAALVLLFLAMIVLGCNCASPNPKALPCVSWCLNYVSSGGEYVRTAVVKISDKKTHMVVVLSEDKSHVKFIDNGFLCGRHNPHLGIYTINAITMDVIDFRKWEIPYARIVK